MATQGLWRRSRDSLENFNEAFLRSQPRFLESRLHEVCLEPFALVRGPTEFAVGGNIESAYQQTLLSKAALRSASFSEILETTNKYLQEENHAYALRKPCAAHHKYMIGMDFLKCKYSTIDGVSDIDLLIESP